MIDLIEMAKTVTRLKSIPANAAHRHVSQPYYFRNVGFSVDLQRSRSERKHFWF